MKKRSFKENVPHHVYARGIGGGIIFYCLEDCIYFITLYFCIAQKYVIATFAFSLMPNHVHAQQMARDRATFTAFNREVFGKFAVTYNRQHGRSGPLFDKPFGSAPKQVGKKIKANISYICNNGAEGRLSKGVLDYKWNLVAYCMESNPFSARVPNRGSSRKFLRARKLVMYNRERLKPLDYKIQEIVYRGLDAEEKKRVIDLILSEYNFLDQNGMKLSFGSLEKALSAMEANCGSEYDIKEDWDDYSVYRRMGLYAVRRGIDLRDVDFGRMSSKELRQWRLRLQTSVSASDRQLDKYLHMNL